MLQDAQSEVLLSLLVCELLLQTRDLILESFHLSIPVGGRRRWRQIRHFLLKRFLDCVLLRDVGDALNDALEAYLGSLYFFLLAVEVTLDYLLLRQGGFHLIHSFDLLPSSCAILMG